MQEISSKPSPRPYFRDLIVVLTLALCFLYYFALASYSPLDNSVNSAYFPPIPTQNSVGLWGANLSALLLYYIGLGAYLLPLSLFMMLFGYLKSKLNFLLAFNYFLFPIFIYATLVYFCSLFFQNISIYGFEISTVGKIGLWIFSSFYSNLGKVGAPFVAGIFSFCGFLLISGNSYFSKIPKFNPKFLFEYKIFQSLSHRFQRK